jgi:hypothetical protein
VDGDFRFDDKGAVRPGGGGSLGAVEMMEKSSARLGLPRSAAKRTPPS